MVTQKIYHAAIYVRLSKEDGDVAAAGKAESNSISNQKNLIKEFLKGREDIEVVSERVDDGYSGSDFERPAFQMMLEDIKRGVVDCVVVKDLSRFGREYIDSGMYIERLFPALGVRFIAVNDGYDSLNRKDSSDDIIIPFKNLINDAYCRDISVKIRSHLEVKRRNGEFIGSFAAYGYQKKEDDRHKLEIDAYAAGVVQDIFRMKLHGMSQDAIANKLNEFGILPPAEYKASRGSNYQTGFKVKEKSEWTSVAVRRILTNEIYIGNLVQGRQTTPNHKVKQAYRKEESDWVRIEKNHEPVVSDRDFEVVQRLLAMDTRTAPGNEEVYPLSGLVVCGGCGMPMIRKTTRAGGKTYSYYICATNKATKECSPHSMSTEKLERAVLALLQKHIENIMDLQKVLAFIGTVPFQQMDMKKLEERKAEKLAEVERCTDLRGMLYEDLKDGMISREEYWELHAAYESRRKNAQLAIRQIDLEMEEILERKSRGFVWLDYFMENRNIEKLTRHVAVSLIREVRVVDKNSIEITFDFDDCYRECMEVGKYMECLFPLLHVRYIAVNEHYDSDNYAGRTGGMEVGIKNVVNMMYSRDASKKVMAAGKVLTEQGKFIGSFAPYGYVKSPKDKHKLIPDPEAAEVVRRIFTLAAEGKKYKEIARILNEAGVETCLDYQKSHGRERKHGTEIKVHQWSATTVMDILYSEVYIGTIVNNRIAQNQRTGYKSKRRKPEEWTVVENCHEPIVSRELYEAAHEKLDRKSQAKKARSGNSPARLFLCGCCGHTLIKRHGKYKCPANLNPAELNCSKVRMDAEVFENTVVTYIRVTAESFLQDLEKRRKMQKETQANEPYMEMIRQKIKKLENRRFQAYDDYTREKLSREEMRSLRDKLQEEINALNETLAAREKEQAELSHVPDVSEEELTVLAELTEFNAETVRVLVKNVTLFEDGNIEIVWNTDDFLRDV